MSKPTPSWRARAFTVAFVLGIASNALAAPPVFESPVPVNDLAADDGGSFEWEAAIATDGTGTWIVVTRTDDSLGGTTNHGEHIAFARSTDGGLSFSPYVALDPGSGARGPAVAGDGSGTWIASWSVYGGFSETLMLARSTDDGATWSAPAVFYDKAGAPAIGNDHAGTWVMIWNSNPGSPSTDRDIWVSRSTDGGAGWSPPVILNSEPGTLKQDVDPKLYFGGGVWIAVWSALPFDWSAQHRDVLYARSLDGGVTWGAPAPLSTTAYADYRADVDPRLATDGAGNWVAVWAHNPLGMVNGGSDGDGDIQFARSSDGGATWTPPALLNADAATDDVTLDEQPTIAGSPAGTYVAMWRRRSSVDVGFGTDDDVFTATSEDGGATWSPPVPLHASMATDSGDDIWATMSYDPAGRWLATWSSTSVLVPWPYDRDMKIVTAFSDQLCGNGLVDPGEVCDDGVRAGTDCCGRACQLSPVTQPCAPDADLCTLDRCDGAGTCLHVYEPRPVCRGTVSAGSSSLQLSVGDTPAATKLGWSWKKGAATGHNEIGYWFYGTDYALCVYDADGLVTRADAPADNFCPPKGPCFRWIGRNGDVKGWKYKDASGTPTGTISMSLSTGGEANGAASAAWKAKGANLQPPVLPVTGSTVTAQLVTDEDSVPKAQCWGATYATTGARNDDRVFKAKGQ